jgi:hypothetical protein
MARGRRMPRSRFPERRWRLGDARGVGRRRGRRAEPESTPRACATWVDPCYAAAAAAAKRSAGRRQASAATAMTILLNMERMGTPLLVFDFRFRFQNASSPSAASVNVSLSLTPSSEVLRPSFRPVPASFSYSESSGRCRHRSLKTVQIAWEAHSVCGRCGTGETNVAQHSVCVKLTYRSKVRRADQPVPGIWATMRRGAQQGHSTAC